MRAILLLLLSCACISLSAQTPVPEILTRPNGTQITTADEWFGTRRREFVEFFEANVYGRAPRTWDQISWWIFDEDPQALGGTATRRQIRIWWNGMSSGPYADVLVYLPNQVKGKIPVVLGLNFDGNHAVCSDPAIRVPDDIMQRSKDKMIERGFHNGQWPVEEILRRGYGLVTASRHEVSSDWRPEYMKGVREVYPSFAEGNENWGTVSAWAWGMSRIADIILQDERIDPDRLTALGFSRLGKAALWAGANDERFSATVSLMSGAGGANMLRRDQGEKIANLTGVVGYWFCRNFLNYAGQDANLPFDFYQMMAMIAPRALYVASASQDDWADPEGEYLGTLKTLPVYSLLGHPTTLPEKFPAYDTPVGAGGRVGYHCRTGKHDVTPQDWGYILDFLDQLK